MCKSIKLNVLVSGVFAIILFVLSAIPAFAEGVEFGNSSSDFSEGTVSTGFAESKDSRTVDSLLMKRLLVQPILIVDNTYYADDTVYDVRTDSGATPYNLKLSSDTKDNISYYGLNGFYMSLTFSVSGTGLQRYEIYENGSNIYSQNISKNGNYTVNWITNAESYKTYRVDVISTGGGITTHSVGGNIS